MALEGPISQIVIDAYPKGGSVIDWASWIQAISAIISLGTTMILGRYAYLFQQSSQKEFDLINRPYLHINPNSNTRHSEISGIVEKIQTEYIIKNVGKLPLTCIIESTEINEQILPPPSNEFIIFPEQEIIIWTAGGNPLTKVTIQDLEYTSSIDVKYWPLNKPNEIYKRFQKRHISIPSNKTNILNDTAS